MRRSKRRSQGLPATTRYVVNAPFPEGKRTEGGTIEYVPPPANVEPFVHTIRTNRIAANLDTIVAYNGQFKYECVWAHDDDYREMFCIWHVRVYDWVSFGVETDRPRHPCVGSYHLVPVPKGAAIATSIIVPGLNRGVLDPEV